MKVFRANTDAGVGDLLVDLLVASSEDFSPTAAAAKWPASGAAALRYIHSAIACLRWGSSPVKQTHRRPRKP